MINIRPRRNRKSEAMRSLIKEFSISTDDLIAPLFVTSGNKRKEEIPSMPDCFRLSLDYLLEEVSELYNLNIKCISLFPVCDPISKSDDASAALNPDSFYIKAISELKSKFPNLLVMTDVALDPYTNAGHDGIVDISSGEILNDATLEILGEMALIQAKAGSDIIGPSDMMDGRVGYIRKVLDQEGMTRTSIMSYTTKYASSFYGPFRDALDSTPKKGDKKTYQMDYSNSKDALRELKLDEEEGADILMVKPGLAYLDILKTMRDKTSLPLAVYNVSGEYAMLKAAVKNGWLENEPAIREILTSFKRAGADIIITYFAKEMAMFLEYPDR